MLNKFSAWANIGSFLVGCIALYMIWPKGHPEGSPSVSYLPVTMWIFLCVLLVTGFLHLAAAKAQLSKPHPLPAARANEQTQPIFVDSSVTPKFLTSFFVGRTEIQAQKSVEIYVGKWMKVTGPIRNVGNLDSLGRRLHVSLNPDSFEQVLVSLIFDKAWRDRLSVLQKETVVTVVGQIDALAKEYVMLDNCEVIDEKSHTPNSNALA